MLAVRDFVGAANGHGRGRDAGSAATTFASGKESASFAQVRHHFADPIPGRS